MTDLAAFRATASNAATKRRNADWVARWLRMTTVLGAVVGGVLGVGKMAGTFILFQAGLLPPWYDYAVVVHLFIAVAFFLGLALAGVLIGVVLLAIALPAPAGRDTIVAATARIEKMIDRADQSIAGRRS